TAMGASRSRRSAAGVCSGSSATGAAVAPSSRPRSNACWVLLVSAGCFLALSLAVLLVDPFPGDAAARRWVLGYGSRAVVEAARVVNYLGNWRVLLPATLLLLIAFPRARARWRLWIRLMLAAPAAQGFLEIVIRRARAQHAAMGLPHRHRHAN